MEIRTNIRRLDLFSMNAYFLPRSPTLYAFWAIVWLAIAVSMLLEQERTNSSIAIILGSGLASALIYLAFLVTFLGISPLFMSRSNSPLGEHLIRLEAEGIWEESAHGSMFTSWSGVNTVHKSRAAIYIRISAGLAYIVPARSFASHQDYESFCRAVSDRSQAKT